MFNYWSVKLLDKVYPIIRDNRFKGHMIAEYDYETKQTVIKYNSRLLSTWSHALIKCGIFHEIGHILQNAIPYDTVKQKVFAEYDAEKYALKMMKRYYKKDLKEVIDFQKQKFNEIRFRKKYPIHYEAFRKLKEYCNETSSSSTT